MAVVTYFTYWWGVWMDKIKSLIVVILIVVGFLVGYWWPVTVRIDTVGAYTATIINNTCISKSGDGGGVGITGTYGSNITGNEFANFMQGIHLNYAHNSIITNNIIPTSNYQGINIRYSNYIEITYNTIQNSEQHGLVFVGTAHDNIVHHNRFVNNSQVELYRIDGLLCFQIRCRGRYI